MMEIALRLAGLDVAPFDSEIQVPGKNVKRVLAGIDMGQAEIVAAKMLGYDCVARHHNLDRKMVTVGTFVEHEHIESLVAHGVAPMLAQKSMGSWKEELGRQFHATNFDAAPQLARLLGMPLIGIHTPADLLAERSIRGHIEKMAEGQEWLTLGDIVDGLKERFREFRDTPQSPQIWAGKRGDYAGRVHVLMSGGLGALVAEYEELMKVGYNTFVVMHMEEKTLQELRKTNRCSVIVTGHMASDSLGFNQILDAWEAEGLEIERIGGIV